MSLGGKEGRGAVDNRMEATGPGFSCHKHAENAENVTVQRCNDAEMGKWGNAENDQKQPVGILHDLTSSSLIGVKGVCRDTKRKVAR